MPAYCLNLSGLPCKLFRYTDITEKDRKGRMVEKRQGRPPKPEGEKRQQIGVRVSPELKSQLEAVAGANGRSVAQEAEFRLAESFELDELLGGGKTKAFLVELAVQIGRAEDVTGNPWRDDATTYWAARKLVEDALDRARPTPPNYAELTRLRTELSELHERQATIKDYLVQCHAITYGNALAALSGKYQALVQSPEETWINPTPDGPALSDEDRTTIRDWWKELREIEAMESVVRGKIDQLMEPWRIAKAGGAAIHNHLTQPELSEEAG